MNAMKPKITPWQGSGVFSPKPDINAPLWIGKKEGEYDNYYGNNCAGTVSLSVSLHGRLHNFKCIYFLQSLQIKTLEGEVPSM